MSWRKIQMEDIERGTVIRLTKMAEGFNTAVIIATDVEIDTAKNEGAFGMVRVARPYAYAHEHFDSRTAMMAEEVFDLSVESMLSANSDVEVFQQHKNIYRMVT